MNDGINELETGENSVLNKLKELEKFGSVLGLERMERLMELLGHPEDSLRCIHVAGTNGKGSVCRYIYEALQYNGYKVGLFISPALEQPNERIEFDHSYISDEDFEKYSAQVLEKVDVMTGLGEDSPTEFEVLTATAILYFAEKNPDFVVMEVGLGGRGDSTNIIKNPEICIITSISYDHMEQLGASLGAIAKEKAGIVKKNSIVVMNVPEREASSEIARKVYEMNGVLHDVSKIGYSVVDSDLNGSTIDANIYGTDYSEMEISMAGAYQGCNLITAVSALEILRKKEVIAVERSRLYEGLKAAKQPARFELMKNGIILDGAHNEAGAAALEEAIGKLIPEERILMVTGMLKDKETSAILEHFTGITRDFIATEPDNPRKWDAHDLGAELESRGCQCRVEPDFRKAVKLALEHKDDYDRIVVAGSLYLVGKVRKLVK